MAKRRRRKPPPQPGLFDETGNGVQTVPLHEAARTRYLSYALSVITSRALPDVRDGLKPVQRRILYTMWQQGMRPDSKPRKCAKVVGDVMGSYHPHGDLAIYDALVRMAQPFSMRMPLVDGAGNFGSMDGDGAAAMRYTECRPAPPAAAMLEEIGRQTVPVRANYDGTRTEPVVLPSRLPNLLINGATGIAVGMATNIPPHNPAEVCAALLALLEDRDRKTAALCRHLKGPDFPTGGQVLNAPEELRRIYEEGTGAVRLRATWEEGNTTRGSKTLVVTSVPYGVNKAQLVERIAEVIVSRKLPSLLDVRDLSADDVRIELELKRDADEAKVLAYLYKNTPLQTNFNVNLTCLLPTRNPEVGRPERCDLKTILSHFLQFRMEVVTRRLEHELETLKRRIHVLEGFAAVFDALDEILDIIRKSDGKADAAAKIIRRFGLDEEQTDAILELKLYRLARLEIQVIRDELRDRRKRAKEIRRLLGDEDEVWGVVKREIEEVRKGFLADPSMKRRTLIRAVEDEPEFTAEDFIVEEDNVVLVTRDGWVRRQKEVRDLAKTKVREGDALLAAEPGSTRAPIAFFSSFGVAYTCLIADVPATTGYGDPIQKRFKLKDGERIVAAFSLDPRRIGRKHAFAATSDGYALRFSFEGFAEPSTRSGRRYARVKEGVEVVGVAAIDGGETILGATRAARVVLCPAEEVNQLSGPGKGVRLIKVAAGDELLGFVASRGDRDLLVVETSRGAQKTVSTAKYEVSRRGGKGREILKQGSLARIVPREVEPPEALS